MRTNEKRTGTGSEGEQVRNVELSGDERITVTRDVWTGELAPELDPVDWIAKLDTEKRELVTESPQELDGETRELRRVFADWLAETVLKEGPESAVQQICRRGLDESEAVETVRSYIVNDRVLGVRALLRETLESCALGMITDEQAAERLGWLGVEQPDRIIEMLDERKGESKRNDGDGRVERLEQDVRDLRWRTVRSKEHSR